jgi:tetratricopeptide (TPR) repeat protein
MKINNRWLAVLLVFAVLPLSGCGITTTLQARDSLNKGVKAWTDNKYAEAAKCFERTLELDPKFETARLYLAIAYMQQYIPGDTKTEEMAYKAINTFQTIIEKSKDPARPSKHAMISITNLYYQLDKFDESKEWCNRILKIYPDTHEAYYRIAVMDYNASLKKTGYNGEMVRYIKERKEDVDKVMAIIDDGLANLNRAIEIRPAYHEAMNYQNLLLREKAKFEKDPKNNKYLQEADLVQNRALELKLKAEEEEAKNPPKTLGILGK